MNAVPSAPDCPTLEQWRLWGRVLARLAPADARLAVTSTRAVTVRGDGVTLRLGRDVGKVVAVALARRGLIEADGGAAGVAFYRLSRPGRDVLRAGTAAVERLSREVERLREACAALRDAEAAAMAGDAAPEALPPAAAAALTPSERIVLERIIAGGRDFVSHLELLDAVYGDGVGLGRDISIINVWICKIRKKLRDAWPGATVVTRWGQGFSFVPPGGVK